MAVRTSARRRTLSLKAVLNAEVKQRGVDDCAVSVQPNKDRMSSKSRKRKHSEIEEESTVEQVSNVRVPLSNGYGFATGGGPWLPGRHIQVNLLMRLLRGESLPPCLYVYGTSTSGKSLTVGSVLSMLQLTHAMVNCRECYCSEVLFTEILSQLSGAVGTGSVMNGKCHSIERFLSMFRQLHGMLNHCPVCIVLDNADHLRDNTLLIAELKRLSVSSSGKVCVIMISVVSVDKFFKNLETLDLLPIHFPQYSKEETLEIMSLDCPSHQPLPFFQTFIHHIWNVFHTVCRDLSELRHLSSTLFPKYVEPVDKGEVSHQETRHLWRHIEPYFRTVMSRIYLREISFTAYEGVSKAYSSVKILELPIYPKYLLLASFLASYNPSRTDYRIFSKSRQSKRRKQHKKSGAEQQQHLGPKEFSLDRMMAIFHSIISETVPPIAHLHIQVSTLVSLQLLSRSSKSEVLDTPKYKSLITLALAQHLARSVGFDLIHHLHDFSA